MTAALFEPLTLRDLTIRNRAWVPPMCQYSVDAMDGIPTDWHLVHYGSLAVGGFGLIVAEATGVLPEGRISPFDTGLWSDDHIAPWRRITDFVHARGAAMGVQLGHAGWRASTDRWWPDYPSRIVPPAEGGWVPVGPCEPFDDVEPYEVLDEAGIAHVIDGFVAAARRADAAGFDAVELHAAHGYLINQFYSPKVNLRTDAWGGDFDGRTRLLRTIAREVRAVWPEHKPLLVRLSSYEGDPDGWSLDDSIRLAAPLKEAGVDLIDVSTKTWDKSNEHRAAPGYLAPASERLRKEGGIPTSVVGYITETTMANDIVASGQADAIMFGRAALRDTNLPLRMAHELGVPAAEAGYQPQRWRGAWR